ncbi:hypothetical protein B0A50_06901 [Salinomyces thailandicus]|uniref:ARS binding protein 2 n=1 Tax=Salinomyces thailandicus TaxID=706561 RepID=A0A4U0TPN7_9PEZI|nr:hypothetical protein B0A50_06901 [Salinomyces thailandica]
MQPPRSISPRLNRSPPGPYRPSDRSLPSLDVDAENLTDVYVSFILYCNPHFALGTDTESLRANFNSPPKSDNKDFETYRLFELIKRLDAKNIKTWGQLALDLGVEPPDVSKGQSVQKVQQYSVRLKRWMRAMHVDAFFEYLMGKQHSYFTEIPHPSDPYPAEGRDGVHAEEDLAIRALDPSFRPKRGRRRNSETELDGEPASTPAHKHRRLKSEDRLVQSLSSAFPTSAHPDRHQDPWETASAITPQSYVPWTGRPGVPQSTVATTAPSQHRWQLQAATHDVSTPHPMTAQPMSMAAHIEAAFDQEPKSAITPSGKRRRKHGPAVSSAWPSNAPGAKPRGRPPANRTTQDGPYNTFPVDPSGRASAPANPSTATPEPHPTVGPSVGPPMPPPVVRRQSDGPGRLTGKLSLQVPRHTGGPVRLATPPPRVLVNGEKNDSEGGSASITPTIEIPPRTLHCNPKHNKVASSTQPTTQDTPTLTPETLKRVLTNDLLRATTTGRNQRLTSDEAKRLATSILQRLGLPLEAPHTTTTTDNNNCNSNANHSPDPTLTLLTAASWLSLTSHLHNFPLLPTTTTTAPTNKKITITRFRTDAEGYQSIVPADETTEPTDKKSIREIFDLSWTASIGACTGTFELKGLTLGGDHAPPPIEEKDSHDEMLQRAFALARDVGGSADGELGEVLKFVAEKRAGPLPASAAAAAGGRRFDEEGVDWKAKCIAMEMGGRMAMGEYQRLRERLVERVLDALI